MDAINLNAGVTVQTLFKDKGIDETTMAAIEEAAKDGFTEDELTTLKGMGVDTDLIRANATGAEDEVEPGPKTPADVISKADEIKAKYCKDITATGDSYSSSNPELKALKKAMDDGVLADLKKAGFTKSQIVEIVNKAFPTVGIDNKDNGGYSLPYGHDQEAKDIYNQFQNQLFNLTTGSSTDLVAAQADIVRLNKLIRNNNMQLRQLEGEIMKLQNEIEDRVHDAMQKSKKIANGQRDQAEQAVKDNLDAYINSNGEMSYDKFKQNLSGDLDSIEGKTNSKLSAVVLDMLQTERKMAQLSFALDTMKGLNDANKNLMDEVDAAKFKIDDATENIDQPSTDPDCNRCDPIGFVDAEGNRYDLFIDNDNNGALSNETEFIGAKNGFDELRNLDTGDNPDGTLTAEEMQQAGVKVVVTKADGTQEIKDAAEVFGKGNTAFGGKEVSFNLNSYQAVNKDIGNNNTLLANFDVNIGDEVLDDAGYQTMDDLAWLDKNYEFTDEIERKGRHAIDETEFEKIDTYDTEIAGHESALDRFKTEMNDSWKNINMSGDAIREKAFNATKIDAMNKAAAAKDKFDKIEKENKARSVDDIVTEETGSKPYEVLMKNDPPTKETPALGEVEPPQGALGGDEVPGTEEQPETVTISGADDGEFTNIFVAMGQDAGYLSDTDTVLDNDEIVNLIQEGKITLSYVDDGIPDKDQLVEIIKQAAIDLGYLPEDGHGDLSTDDLVKVVKESGLTLNVNSAA